MPRTSRRKASRIQLMEIGSLIDRGFIKPIVADVLPIEQARRAFEMGLESGRKGKIVLRVG